MAKILLLSMLVATVVIPLLAAKTRHPGRALKRAVFFTLAFNTLYLVTSLVLYPSLAFR